MINKNILYSFVIPHHNTPELLQRLVDSIPQRDDVEIIVVDDNSDEDKKANVIRPNVRTIYIEKDNSRGAGKARNLGLAEASGKWIVFADADDFFNIPALESVLEIYKNSEYEIVVFPIRIVKSDTLEEGEWRDTWFNTLFYSDKSNRQKLLGTAAVWSKLIRRSFIMNNKISFEEIKYSNDQWFSVNVAVNASLIKYDSCYKIYTLTYTENSLTRNRNIEAFECKFNAELRYWKVVLKSGIKNERYTYQWFLSWASDFGVRRTFTAYIELKRIKVPFFPSSYYKYSFLWLMRCILKSLVLRYR